MTLIWFKRRHQKPNPRPGSTTSTSSSTISSRLHPHPIPQPKPKPHHTGYHRQSPCATGINYWCFSLATAKHCKYVSIHLKCYGNRLLLFCDWINYLFQTKCTSYQHPGKIWSFEYFFNHGGAEWLLVKIRSYKWILIYSGHKKNINNYDKLTK